MRRLLPALLVSGLAAFLPVSSSVARALAGTLCGRVGHHRRAPVAWLPRRGPRLEPGGCPDVPGGGGAGAGLGAAIRRSRVAEHAARRALRHAKGGSDAGLRAWHLPRSGRTRAMDVEVLNSSVFVTKLDAPLLCETAGKLAGGEAPERFRTEPMLSLASPRGIRFWRRLTSIWRDVRKDAPWLRSAPAVDEARSRLAEALIDAIGRAGSDRAPACGPAALQRVSTFG